jgi:hypothetical protein
LLQVMNNYALVRWRMGHLDTALGVFTQLLRLYAALDAAATRLHRHSATQASDDDDDGGGGAGGGKGLDPRAARRSGELLWSQGAVAAGVPPEDIAMTLCHVALVGVWWALAPLHNNWCCGGECISSSSSFSSFFILLPFPPSSFSSFSSFSSSSFSS